MTRLRQFLRNSARLGLRLSVLVTGLCLAACSSSTNPTYKTDDLEKTLPDICRSEYKIDIAAKLTGRTFWVYIPLENIISKPQKPQKYTERFAIEQNKEEIKDGVFKFDYLIKTLPEEKEKEQQANYDKSVSEKINNVWKAMRRVLFSLEKSAKNQPQIFCMVAADIKNGFLIRDMFYLEDLKKVSYEFISWEEFHHRTVQDVEPSFAVIGDKEGKNINYRDLTLGQFLAAQIRHRIQLKFSKPEVERNADIDKEIVKVVAATLHIYKFRDFNSVELYNSSTQNRIILNRAAALSGVSN